MCGHSAGRGGSKFWVSGMTARGESHVLDHVVRISSGGSRGLIFGHGPGFLPSSLVESRKPPSPKQGPLLWGWARPHAFQMGLCVWPLHFAGRTFPHMEGDLRLCTALVAGSQACVIPRGDICVE